MNAIGVTPATYTTSSFLIQQAIENSNEYKRGRIRIVRTTELAEEIHIERPKHTTAIAEPCNPAPTAEAEGISEDAAPIAPTTPIEFSCNDDAKDYLEQTFGNVRSKLRNRDDIINAGKAHNVEIIFV